MKRVVVSGIGLESPVGTSLESASTWLTNGRSALSSEDFVEKSGATRRILVARSSHAAAASRRTGVVAEDRSVSMAVSATRTALENANLLGIEFAEFRSAMSVSVGTGVGSVHALESAFTNWQAVDVGTYPLTVVRGLHNAIAAEIAIRHGIHGPARTFAMACASSGVAVANAVRDIRAGSCRAAVVCGADAPLTQPMIDAWLAMRVYASDRSPTDGEDTGCVPFSSHRTGLALAECAATLILEDLDSVRARGHEPIAEILGCGESTDATHLTNPSRDGQIAAMKQALLDARVTPDQIAYINAHATGTVAGDVVEAESISHLFPGQPMVSSTKAIHGHSLGAAGTLEAIMVIATLKSRCVPPTLGLRSVDPKCSAIRHVLSHPDDLPADGACLTNSFAFGGHNVSLILQAIIE